MKIRMKIVVDAAMTVILLLLMAYERIGQAAHEWLGVGCFLLFLLHHLLNRGWHKNLFRRKYASLRVAQTLLALLLCVTALGSMWSGIVLSRHVFTFLPIHGSRSAARVAHLLCGYWNFVLISLHIGFHWGIMLGLARKLVKKPSAVRKWTLQVAALLLAGYGVFAFIKREIGTYVLLQSQFVFFDYEEPLLCFFADYIAVMALFTLLGYYLTKALKHSGAGKDGGYLTNLKYNINSRR